MKKSLVLAMAMALGISATAFAANPFSDVPPILSPMCRQAIGPMLP